MGYPAERAAYIPPFRDEAAKGWGTRAVRAELRKAVRGFARMPTHYDEAARMGTRRSGRLTSHPFAMKLRKDGAPELYGLNGGRRFALCANAHSCDEAARMGTRRIWRLTCPTR